MFDRNKLGPLVSKPLYNNIVDFYMGVFAAYDENDFEHELDTFNTELKTKMNESGTSLDIETMDMIGQKKQSLMIYEKYDILTMTGVRLVKELLYSDASVGNVEIYVTQSHSMYEIDSLSFELGKKFGQRIIDLVNFFKTGIGKEIFDSVVLFFLTYKQTDINVKITSHTSGENSFSAECSGHRFFSSFLTGQDKYTVTHEENGLTVKINAIQEKLDYLKNGIIDVIL